MKISEVPEAVGKTIESVLRRDGDGGGDGDGAGGVLSSASWSANTWRRFCV